MAALRREDVTAKIRQQKVLLQKNWRDLANELNLDVEFTIAACLGQMKFTPEQAQKVGQYFQLTPEECLWLTEVPYRNTLNGRLPTDPILYRLHEGLGSSPLSTFYRFIFCQFKNRLSMRWILIFYKLGVYGPAIKEILHEDFGDGVMSAIDYSCKVDNDGSGRVQIVLNGKFLPYHFHKQS